MWASTLDAGPDTLGDVGETRGDAAAGQVVGLLDVAVVGHADRQPPVAHPEREPVRELHAGFFNQIAARDAHVDGAFGTQHGNVVGAEERDIDRHVAHAGEQSALLPAEVEAGLERSSAAISASRPLLGMPMRRLSDIGIVQGSGFESRFRVRVSTLT